MENPIRQDIAPGKGIRIPELEKSLVVKSRILGFGIRNTAQEIRNPTSIGIQNPSPTDREGIQYLESGTHSVKSMLKMMDLARCSPFTQFLTV